MGTMATQSVRIALLATMIFMIDLNRNCLALDHDSSRPPHRGPCGYAICEGDTVSMGFTIAEKTISFRIKKEEVLCGIVSGHHCGRRPDEPPKMEEEQEGKNNESMVNTTMETTSVASENEQEIRKSEEIDQNRILFSPPKLVGGSSVAKHFGKQCKNVALAMIIGWNTLERFKTSGRYFNGSDGKMLSKDAIIESPTCNILPIAPVEDSESKAEPNRDIEASTFRMKMDFPGVLNDTKARLDVDFTVIIEEGNYTYEGKRIPLESNDIRMRFTISDTENWFCDDDNNCADYARFCFKANVGKVDNPQEVLEEDEICVHHTCQKMAKIFDTAQIGTFLLANKNGTKMVLPKEDVVVGLDNCINITKLEANETFSFEFLLVPPTRLDLEYIVPDEKENPKPPKPPKQTPVSKVAALTSSIFSLLSLLVLCAALNVAPE